MKKRRVLFIGILVILISSIFIFYCGKTTDVYIGVIGDTDATGVNIQLKINEKLVWNNDILSGLNNYTKISERFKFGYNTIEVLSKDSNLLVSKRIFISINQHIVIEYITPFASVAKKEALRIEIRNGKFSYE